MAEQPFKKFTSSELYNSWIENPSTEFPEDWVTLVGTSEVHYSNSTPIPIADSTTVLVGTRVARADTLAGDVYMYDTINNTNFWMRPAIFTDNIGYERFAMTQFTPIAVVAIPASHDVYGTGEVGMVSLNYMSTTDPENGGNTQSIRWGYNDADLSLPNLTQVPVYSNRASTSLTSNSYGYLPSDNFTSGSSLSGVSADEDAKYNQSSIFIPSPYTQNGGRNELYSSTSVATSNCLSDFDGKGNTDVIIAATTADWSGTITNSSSAGNYPAACCCRRYHKGNTIAGDWYLPAAGEGGYLIARFSKINQALAKIKLMFDSTDTTSCVLVSTKDDHWLSTEHSSNNARYLTTSNGEQNNYYKSNYHYVRGWLRA